MERIKRFLEDYSLFATGVIIAGMTIEPQNPLFTTGLTIMVAVHVLVRFVYVKKYTKDDVRVKTREQSKRVDDEIKSLSGYSNLTDTQRFALRRSWAAKTPQHVDAMLPQVEEVFDISTDEAKRLIRRVRS